MNFETPTEPRDEDLLKGTARGDLASFHTFYQRHASRVTAYAQRLCGDATLTEDVAQEVFTAVWTRAGTYRPDRGGISTWLYALTRNKIIDLWRRSARNGPAEELDERWAAPVFASAGDLRLTLRQALKRVAPEQRRAIELAYFGGFTYEEVAGHLDLPIGTLKSRIRLGMQKMRTVLEEGVAVA
jgi:RNA polymerase sigma-70 factor (ECF subfamily)